MSILKYKTGGWQKKIEPIEVLRETSASVYLARNPTPGNKSTERRESKRSEYAQYHDSWQLAHAHLMANAESKVVAARRALELANAELGNIKGMKMPRGAA